MGTCEHGNHTQVQTRTTTLRSFGGYGLSPFPNEIQRSLFMVKA